MKIDLIIPPSPFLTDERVFVSLGILRVAGQLERDGHDVRVVDLSGISNYEVAAVELLRDEVQLVGITATTPQMPAAHRIRQAIRDGCSWMPIAIGGPHPTLVAAAVRQEIKRGVRGRAHRAMKQLFRDYDCVVAGDGEFALQEYLRKREEAPVPVFIDADDPKSTLFMLDSVYEQTPMPARHLVDLSSYHYSIDGVRATSLIAQLGCPFQCGFCGGRASPMLRRIRTRSIESITHEMEYLYGRYGYRGFMFYDDELNVNKNMVQLMGAIVKLQERIGVEFRLRGFVKAELFTKEQAELMYRAGFRWLLCGFESGDPRILRNINKKANKDDNCRAVSLAHDAGLKVKALMSVGHPGESEQTIKETRTWLLDVCPEEFDITVITPYPGSPYYDEADASQPGVWTYTYGPTGDRLHMEEVDYNQIAEYYKGDPNGGYQSHVWTDHLSARQIVELRDWVEKDVRERLEIPFPVITPAIKFEHSMGQN